MRDFNTIMANSTSSPPLRKHHNMTSTDTAVHPKTPAAETSTSSSTVATSASLSPSDALALRRDGPEIVISKLRHQLQMAEETAASSRSNASKAEAIILELKGTIRQLKRQTHPDVQTQLDQAHAQLLTADMVRKELEDTLEAEQYTWDLRVQEQERTISELQQQMEERQQQHDEEMRLVMEERSELQACLDEALKELEAVDAELQNNNSEIESIQMLHDFCCEKFNLQGVPLEEYSTVSSLASAIRDMLEEVAEKGEHHHSRELDAPTKNGADITALRKELTNREASCAELRTSLKEAVALLKPLQDAVGKGDRERARLQDQVRVLHDKELSLQANLRDVKSRLRSAEDENEQLRSKAESLEIQLSRSKLEVASSVVSHQHSVATAESASSRLRAKRQSEQTLKQMLADTQSKFAALQQQKEQFSAQNSELQRQMDDSLDVKEYEEQIDTLRADIERLQREILEKDAEIAELRDSRGDTSVNQDRLNELERELEEKTKSLATKRENERILNKSLKDALSLIKPLQMHLEEAENEKTILANQLAALQSEEGIAATIRQLEQENAALQDALEQMSQSISGSPTDKRLAQELVELQSRYAVTQQRLEHASMQNESLMEQLHSRDQQDHELFKELSDLREKAPYNSAS